MNYKCSKCKCIKYISEEIKIEYTKEIVTVIKCADCHTVLDSSIERPKGMVLKEKRGAGEIRFSENEKRSFSSSWEDPLPGVGVSRSDGAVVILSRQRRVYYPYPALS